MRNFATFLKFEPVFLINMFDYIIVICIFA